ncbi:hypothetical protein PGT21_001745 [Puccinia graminis f. sp. tritici]|uniref:Uncharacterized protein n=1 Tax=Puccinia graminis f. sp. tritici TaxID=56615 RepID=A0A5B0QLY7_PUCGR|nr:hypothetical protein PGT21_001745 [Puccinia graminis f. sp. tritici]
MPSRSLEEGSLRLYTPTANLLAYVMATWPSGLRRRLKEVAGTSTSILAVIRRSSGIEENTKDIS